MKIGTRIRVTKTKDDVFKVGDTAVLKRQDSDGDWWATFDDGDWRATSGDCEWCLQKGWTEFEVIEDEIQ